MKIQDKVLFISGGNRGIGKATVDEAVKRGAKKIYVGARNLDSVQPLIDQHGDRIVAVELDLTNKDTIVAAAEIASDTEILINNAGVLVAGSMTDGTIEDSLMPNFKVNVLGTIQLTEALLPHLREKESAAIVSVASVVGLASMPMGGTYSMSKAAVHSMIQSFRAELSQENILVSGVYPGPVETDMTTDFKGMVEMSDPAGVGTEIIEGIENDQEYIFPDPMSKQVGEVYKKSPYELERMMANFGK